MASNSFLEAIASPLRASEAAYLGGLGSVATKSSDTELIISTSQAVTTGNDIMVALSTDPNSSLVVGVADDAGNTYVQIGSTVINSGQIRTYLFVAYDVNSMAAGSDIIISATPAVTSHAAVAGLFSGLADVSTLDQIASGTGTSTSPSSGAASSTTQADELLIGVIGTEGPVGDSAGT